MEKLSDRCLRLDLLESVHEKIVADFGLNPDRCSRSRVDAAFVHHFQVAGKQTRPTLALESCQALGIETHVAVAFAACIESLHNASLVQDDLQDGALERRGRPTVHNLFGKDVALGLVTRLVSTAYVSLQSPGYDGLCHLLSRAVHEAISETINGQTRDLDPRTDRSVYNLLAIARQKSGPLFALAVQLPLIVAGHVEKLPKAYEAACRLGLGYQIIDDLKDRQMDRLQETDCNIVNALARDGNPKEASTRAIAIAESELVASAKLASELPSGSGSHLRLMAEELLGRLGATRG